jgi:hypothetical protein
MTAITTATPSYVTIELLTLSGSEFRRVSSSPPRPATANEIPVIDLSTINGTTTERKALASAVKAVAQGSGFFYVKNHGIPNHVIADALNSAKDFFNQSANDKLRSNATKTKHRNGFRQSGSTQINRAESRGQQVVSGPLTGLEVLTSGRYQGDL